MVGDLLADGDAVGNADQIRVFEFDAGAFVAVVDGRVTRRSLFSEGLAATCNSALIDTPLPIAYAVFACGLHSDLQNNQNLQDNAQTVLVNEVVRE